MFESTLVNDAKGARAALSFSTSLLLQAGLISTGVAISILAPIAIPSVPDLQIAPPHPRFRDAVKLVRVRQSPSSTSSMPSPIPRPTPIFTYVPPGLNSRSVAFEGDPVAINVGSGLEDAGPIVGSGIPNVTQPPPPPPKPPARKEEPAPPKRLAIGGQVLAAQILNRVQPVYPALARQARIEGVVQLHGIISKEGRIVSLSVITGHPLLVKAALDAVSQWTYRPTYLNQQAIEVEAPIEVRFVLGR